MSDSLTIPDRYTVHSLSDLVSEHEVPTTTTWLCPLLNFSVISVEGEESLNFLNNNLSSNVKEVSENNAQWSSHCNAKGRANACFLVFKHRETYYLRTGIDLRESQMKQLQMFILRAKVVLAAANYCGIGIAGEKASQQLSSLGIQPTTHAHEQYSVIRFSENESDRYEIYAPEEYILTMLDALAGQVTFVQNAGWQLLNILAGIPSLYPETIGQFVPQMLNLDVLGGISFSKGCYPGQEIIARTHYLGKLKRRMFAFRTQPSTDEPIIRGTPVFAPGYHTEQASGSVIDVCSLKDSTVGLAVLRTQGMESGLFLHRCDGTKIDLLPLPYRVPPDSFNPEKKS